MNVQLFKNNLLKRVSFFCVIVFAPLWKISWLYLYVSTSVPSTIYVWVCICSTDLSIFYSFANTTLFWLLYLYSKTWSLVCQSFDFIILLQYSIDYLRVFCLSIYNLKWVCWYPQGDLFLWDFIWAFVESVDQIIGNNCYLNKIESSYLWAWSIFPFSDFLLFFFIGIW